MGFWFWESLGTKHLVFESSSIEQKSYRCQFAIYIYNRKQIFIRYIIYKDHHIYIYIYYNDINVSILRGLSFGHQEPDATVTFQFLLPDGSTKAMASPATWPSLGALFLEGMLQKKCTYLSYDGMILFGGF